MLSIATYIQQTRCYYCTAHTQGVQLLYKLKLVYDPVPKSQTLKESVTCCACLELYSTLGIEAYQISASCLVFTSDRDRTLALLYLSSSTSFTVVCAD